MRTREGGRGVYIEGPDGLWVSLSGPVVELDELLGDLVGRHSGGERQRREARGRGSLEAMPQPHTTPGGGPLLCVLEMCGGEVCGAVRCGTGGTVIRCCWVNYLKVAASHITATGYGLLCTTMNDTTTRSPPTTLSSISSSSSSLEDRHAMYSRDNNLGADLSVDRKEKRERTMREGG